MSAPALARPAPARRAAPARFAPVAALLVAALAVTVRDPHMPGSWGACPTWALLGVACPGCGSLRALHDLVAGHWAEAIGHNALALPAVVFAVFASLRTPGARWTWLWLAAFVVFTVLRNVPGSPLAP